MRMRRVLIVAALAFLVAGLALLSPSATAGGAVAEAEAGTGAGTLMARSAASGQRSVWLHAGEARDVPFSADANGRYVLSVRYSNDNYGPLESVDVRVDGAPVGRFSAQDTGDWGFGWNNFLWSASLGPVTLTAGAHRATTTLSGGDGYGVEVDAIRIERMPDPVLTEAEAGSGDGVLQPRSAASGQRTVRLRHGQSQRVPVHVPVAATYVLSLRYSNDNWGPLETVTLLVDGVAVGQFAAQDTGDYGAGWNVFVWSDAGTRFLSAGLHQMAVQVTGGDPYGIEADVLRLSPST